MLLLARTMAFGQGKVTNKQAGACLLVISLSFLLLHEDTERTRDSWQAR
jgi:hypothetical protein